MAQSVDSDRLSSAGISTHSSGTAGTVGGSVVGVRVGDPGLKRDDEDEYNLGPLPPMWEKAFTPSGEVYFIDHNSGTSHWLDPRLARVRKHSLGECGEDELPFGWERVTDERYGSYYVDHINRRTQYENPVLQARRLRAEKLSSPENGGPPTPNGAPPTGELRGEQFTVTLTKGPQGLGFTLVAAEGVPEIEGYLQIRSIVPHGPAWMDGGLWAGDVVAGVDGGGVRGLSHAAVAALFANIPSGGDVTLSCVRGYPLSFDSADPHTRVLSTRAVDTPPAPAPAPAPAAAPAPLAMQHLTTALRTRFNLESPAPPSRDEVDSPAPPAPRCPSPELCNNTGIESSSSGRSLCVSLRRGAAGFGFTVADSLHGQKVKKVLDRSRCAGLREGDLLLQIGDVDVRRAPHQRVVQVLKECPSLSETCLRVWRRSAARAPRARSATRHEHTGVGALSAAGGRSKTPTAEQLRPRGPPPGDDGVEATYAVPDRSRDCLLQRRRRTSTPGAPLTLPNNNNNNHNNNHSDNHNNNDGGEQWQWGWEQWDQRQQTDKSWSSEWGAAETPTVRVDMYWRGSSQADSSDNGFPEEVLLPPSSGLSHNTDSRLRGHSPDNSTDVVRSPSPGSAADHLLRRSHSPNINNTSNGGEHIRVEGSPPGHLHSPHYEDAHNNNYQHNYPQMSPGSEDPLADVLVRVVRGAAGFGFRIVGGTEDGTPLAVGHVVQGGPAEGLLRAGDLLTSVDGRGLQAATHAAAVAAVCQAAARGHVTLGVRHNRADVHAHVHATHHNLDPSPRPPHTSYNILHPAPLYPQPANVPMYLPSGGGWAGGGRDVWLQRGAGEGFGFVVISSTNKATSTIGQLIPDSPAARCGLLAVGDSISSINGVPVRNLAHPELVALIKSSGRRLHLTVHRQ